MDYTSHAVPHTDTVGAGLTAGGAVPAIRPVKNARC